jgi:hypothetical protein
VTASALFRLLAQSGSFPYAGFSFMLYAALIFMASSVFGVFSLFTTPGRSRDHYARLSYYVFVIGVVIAFVSLGYAVSVSLKF